MIKYFEKKEFPDLKFASFPIIGTNYVWEQWGKTYDEAKKRLFEDLIDYKI